MAGIDPLLREFVERVDATLSKEMYKKERSNIRRDRAGFPTSFEVHHIIPIKISSHWVIYHATSAGWRINDDSKNGLPLPKDRQESELYGIPYHRRSWDHRRYTEEVARLLDAMEEEAKKNNWSDSRIRDELEKLVSKIVLIIKEMGGGQCIDDISFSSSSCYIATAALQGEFDVEVLDPLKAWRYEVLEQSWLGLHLSDYYRRTAPYIAPVVAQRPRLASLLRHLLVLPALSIVNQQKPSFYKSVQNLTLWFIFVLGLLVGECLKPFRANKK